MTDETYNDLQRAMFREMVELLGPDYVPDYYEQAAQPFIFIAQSFINEARAAKK